MDQGNRRNRSATLTEQQIRDVDKLYVSPGERANYIWTILRAEHPDLTDWDVICFAAEYLAMMSQQHLWLQDAVKRVVGLVYAAHYMNAENIDAKSVIKRAPGEAGSTVEDQPARSESGGERQGDGAGTIRTRFWPQ